MVVSGLRCNAGLRFLSGFLTMYMAFLLREAPFEGWEDRKTLLLALVVGAAGLGNTVGVLVGSVLKTRKPEATVVVVLLADVCAVGRGRHGLLTDHRGDAGPHRRACASRWASSRSTR